MDGVGGEDGLEGGGSKNKREMRHQREMLRRAGRTELVRQMAEEVTESPQLVEDEDGGAMSAFAKREKRRMEQRERMEEDLFVRVPLSKMVS
jgi:hypothetical protein